VERGTEGERLMLLESITTFSSSSSPEKKLLNEQFSGGKVFKDTHHHRLKPGETDFFA